MNDKAVFEVDKIVRHFDIQGAIGETMLLNKGHIHDTFRLRNSEPGLPDYLLQRINHQIFKDVSALMKNILIVTDHIRKKVESVPQSVSSMEVLTVILSKKGQGYCRVGEDDWRLYRFIDNAHSYDVVKTMIQAIAGGKGFGRFLSLLSDLDVSMLQETIPHFHDVEDRFRIFEKAIERDSAGRAGGVSKEAAFVNERIDAMAWVNRSGKQGLLPLRTTHNDTKFNNVLLDQKDQALCVVDLDTVMPGYIAYDFGDAIRTIVNTTVEDEKDLEKININLDLLKGFAQGFLSETRGFITVPEIDSLSKGVLLMPFIMGLRFLTDYIDGDKYYKIVSPGHNLQRARAQFRLVELLEAKYEEIQEIIKKEASLNL